MSSLITGMQITIIKTEEAIKGQAPVESGLLKSSNVKNLMWYNMQEMEK